MAYLRKQKHFDGKVGIGSTSPSRLLTLDGTSGAAYLQLTNDTSGNGSDNGLELFQSGVNSYIANRETGSVYFRSANTDRMTIDSSGNVGIGTTNPSPYGLYVDVDNNNDFAARIDNRNSSTAYVLLLKTQNVSHNNTSQTFITGYDAEGAEFNIYSDGSFYQNSDRRTKENIVDVESMLEKINSLKVKTYNRIGDVDKGHHIGLISQDVEEIFPHLVTTDKAKDAVLDEDGDIKEQATEERKALYKIGLIFPLIKAVQELSAKVTALENA